MKADIIEMIQDMTDDDECFMLLIGKRNCNTQISLELISNMDKYFAFSVMAKMYDKAMKEISPDERAQYEAISQTKH